MRLTLIRHLPTEWNKKTWLQGRRDIGISSITDTLRHEIAHNKQLLKKQSPFDIVLASTLLRTNQTALLYSFQPQKEPLLDELDFGPFEGRPKIELIKKYGELWIENPKEVILGESLLQLEERIILFLEKYQEFSNMLIFGHGSWMRAIISYFEYGDINHMNKIILGNNECVTLPIRNGGLNLVQHVNV